MEKMNFEEYGIRITRNSLVTQTGVFSKDDIVSASILEVRVDEEKFDGNNANLVLLPIFIIGPLVAIAILDLEIGFNISMIVMAGFATISLLAFFEAKNKYEYYSKNIPKYNQVELRLGSEKGIVIINIFKEVKQSYIARNPAITNGILRQIGLRDASWMIQAAPWQIRDLVRSNNNEVTKILEAIEDILD